MPKPKTPEDWNRLYLKHQVYLHGIKSLELQMVKTGAGKTGARHFHYWKVPPIRWWNPDVNIHEQKLLAGESKLIIEKVDGKKIELVVDGMKDEEIYNALLSHSDAAPVASKEASVQ